MNIREIEWCKMTPALAYVLGMIFPLCKTKKIAQLGEKEFLIGSVNHNSGMVSEEELNQHYLKVYQLLNKYDDIKQIELRTNKSVDYNVSPKEGFSIMIEITDVDMDEVIDILSEKTKEIKGAAENIKKAFATGCFDGRSSWDKTAHYLSIDVDRDYPKQDLIVEILESLGIEINLNRRAEGDKKNDQIRIKPESIEFFMENIGLYSTCRTKLIEKGLYS